MEKYLYFISRLKQQMKGRKIIVDINLIKKATSQLKQKMQPNKSDSREEFTADDNTDYLI